MKPQKRALEMGWRGRARDVGTGAPGSPPLKVTCAEFSKRGELLAKKLDILKKTF